MTTGRINQVTIVHGRRFVKKAARPAREAGRSRLRGGAFVNQIDGHPAGSQSSNPIELLAEPTIQLPFLNSPRSESAEEGDRDSVGLGHVVLEWRLPIAGHARRRLPFTGVPPNASISNVSQRPTIHRLPHRGVTLNKVTPASGFSQPSHPRVGAKR